jgi:hypothetical protein
MEILALGVSALVGAGLALRFKVLVLVPATLVAATLVALIGKMQGFSGGSIALETVLAAVACQIGYLAGIAVRYYAASAARSSLREH